MKLNLKNRFTLIQLMPEKTSFEKGIVKDDIINKIKITQEDLKEFNIKSNEEGSLVYPIPVEGSDEKDFSFTDAEAEFIKDLLFKLSAKEELVYDQVTLYKLFR